MIPRAAISVSIQLCLTNAKSRLREAAVLLDAGYQTQAAVLFSFGVEEFGKAALLRAAYETGDDPPTVDRLGDHEAKLQAAAKLIPEEKLLLHSGAFDRTVFDPAVFDVGNPVDYEARLSGLYVGLEGRRLAIGGSGGGCNSEGQSSGS